MYWQRWGAKFLETNSDQPKRKKTQIEFLVISPDYEIKISLRLMCHTVNPETVPTTRKDK